MMESKVENIENLESETEKDEDSSSALVVDHEFLSKILSRLESLLEQESHHLEHKDFASANNLIEKKMDIVNFLNLHKDEILQIYNSQDEEFVEKKQNLKELARKLLNKSKENMGNVMREQYVNEKTVKIIQDLVQKEGLKYKNYHNTGSKKKGNKESEEHYVLINKNI